MKEFIPVFVTTDNSGHWYVIPCELKKDCAYLIAKKLLEENKQNEIRITYLSNPY